MFNFNPLQRAWLDALKSGRFRRGKSCLATKKNKRVEYCCLGVACVIARKKGFKISKLIVGSDKERFIAFDGEVGILSKEMVRLLNLRSPKGVLRNTIYPERNRRDYSSLTEMNDNGMSHKAIAAEIERDPKNFFNI